MPVSRAQYWLLLLADWTLSGDGIRVGFSKYKSVMLNACITSIPDIMAILFLSPLAQEKNVDWYPQNGSFYPPDYWNALFDDHSNGTYCLCIQRCLPTYSFSTFPCHQLSNHVPSKSLTIQPNTGHSSWISIYPHDWSFPLPWRVDNWVNHSKFCPLGGFPFTTICHDCLRKGL